MPLEQIGNALTFEAFYTDSGAGALGLTVTVDVWELTAGGVATEIVAGGAVTEMGDGLYYYQLAAGSVDAEAIYTAVFKIADACDQAHIVAGWVVGPTWVENVDGTISGIPDAVLSRDVANVEDTASTNSLAELLLAAFESKMDTDAGTWTIYKTGHVVVFNTRTVTPDVSASPIVEVT